MDYLAAAVEGYLKLPVEHPNEQDEFVSSMHRLQDLLAVRIARRYHPDGWAVYGEEKLAEPEPDRGPFCPTFLSPGPPHYAASCLLPYGHEGEHKFPSAEESQSAWLQKSEEGWPFSGAGG